MKMRLALSNIDAGLLYLERKNDMDNKTVDRIVYAAKTYAAMNGCELENSIYVDPVGDARELVFKVYYGCGFSNRIGNIVLLLNPHCSEKTACDYFSRELDKSLYLYKRSRCITDNSVYGLGRSAHHIYNDEISYSNSDNSAWLKNNPCENLYRKALETMKIYNFEIKKVIFNDPATIVFWKDGSKTVVKAQIGETFDPEKGLAMAIAKKALGNEGNYYNTFKKFIPKE